MTGDIAETLETAFRAALDFRARARDLPPRPVASFDELKARFDIPLAQLGRDPARVIGELVAAAEPGLVINTGPNFFGWVMGASHHAGVAADWLTSVWGQNAGIYRTAPSAAVAEKIAGQWILDLLDLPPESSVGFASGATTASLICLIVARDKMLAAAGWPIRENGVFGAPPVRIILGEEAHSTIFAALGYLGFGERNIVRVAVDDQGRMRADDLAFRLAGTVGPKIVIAQAGHINSGAFDPLLRVAELAKERGAWLHIDGAFGLWARAAPNLKTLCKGAELADSWSVDGHKWLQAPYDCAFAIVRDGQAHEDALKIAASYLDKAPEGAHNPSSLVLELSRRARGFAVWALLQTLGRAGVEEMVTRHCRCARALRDRLINEPGIAILNDVVLNQLAIAFGDGATPEAQARLTEDVVAAVQKENRSYVGPATWKGRRIMRVSVISGETEEANIDILAETTLAAWRRIRPNSPSTTGDAASGMR